jgi:hypothetical protein
MVFKIGKEGPFILPKHSGIVVTRKGENITYTLTSDATVHTYVDTLGITRYFFCLAHIASKSNTPHH